MSCASRLLRRRQLGAAFGHYQGKHYRYLSGVATALAALAGQECAYLPAALCSGPAPPPAGAATLAVDLDLALERLQLLYEPHTRQHFLPDGGLYKTLLAARLNTLATLATTCYAALADSDRLRADAVQQALREGYALLLAPPGA